MLGLKAYHMVLERLDVLAHRIFRLRLSRVGGCCFSSRLRLRSFLEFLLAYVSSCLIGSYCVVRALFGGLGSVDDTNQWGWLSLVECVSEVIKSKYPNSGWATFGNLQVVGNGWEKTTDDCGKYKHIKGCLRVDLHNIVTLDGKDYRGKVYVRLVHTSCYNWRCKTCYKSVAAREARNVEKRINEHVRLHGGVPEHIILSVPRSDWGLDLGVLRRKAEKVAESCGVIGACDIFHHARYANAEEARVKGVPFGWRLGFH